MNWSQKTFFSEFKVNVLEYFNSDCRVQRLDIGRTSMPVDCRYYKDTAIEDDTEPLESEITLCIPCFGTLIFLRHFTVMFIWIIYM